MAALLFLLLPALLLLAAGLVVVLLLVVTRRPDHTLSSEVASARRHALLTSALAGLVLAGTVGLLVWSAALRPSGGHVAPTPVWLGALPLIGAVVTLPVLALGELTWPRPRDQRRMVALNPRTMRDVVPRGWTVSLVIGAGVTLAVVLVGWFLADGSGRSITAVDLRDGRLSATSGPFPGSFYGFPQLVALVAAAALLLLVLRRVVLRPAVVRADVATDNRLRAASAVRAVRVVLTCLLLTAGGDLFFGGAAAANAHGAGWQHTVATTAQLGGLALGVVALVVLLVPAPRLRHVSLPSVPESSATTAS